MKNNIPFLLIALASLAILNSPLATAFAQGTAFTYQGRLDVAGAAANGAYDLTFTVFDTNQPAGNLIAGPLTNSATGVSNGLFTVTLDFGAGVFTGPRRWLEIAARTNGVGSFSTLAPRQQLTPTPYAMFANTASNVLGAVPSAQITGTISPAQFPPNVVTNMETGVVLGGAFSGNGGGLTNLNASQLNTGTVPTNVLAGFQAPYYAVLGGGQNNTANNTYAVVSGGANNTASYLAVAGGGYNNNAGGFYSTIPGGYNNTATGMDSFAAGQNAQALHQGTFVWADSQPGLFASTGNDTFNVRAYGGVNFSTRDAVVTINGSKVVTVANLGNSWQTTGNAGTSPTNGNFLGTTDNQPLELWVDDSRALRLEPDTSTNDSPNLIGGSPGNFAVPGSLGATIGGGGDTNADPNSVTGSYGTVGGGEANTAGYLAVVAGGNNNTVWGQNSTIGGGANNTIQSDANYDTLSGGWQNQIQANSVFSTVAGGVDNVIEYSLGAVICGGSGNLVQTNGGYGVIAGGAFNQIGTNSIQATIGGGIFNQISGNASDATIAGGQNNTVTLNAYSSTIGGGYYNSCTGIAGTVPGGYSNIAAGTYSFAAGQQAQAMNLGAFVWADSQNAPFASTGNDQFCIRAQGGVQLGTNTSLYFGSLTRQMVNLYGASYGMGVQAGTVYQRTGAGFAWFKGGVHNDALNNPGTGGSVLMTLTSGGLTVNGTLASTSDRNAKEDFAPVNPADVLAKVAAMPITKWIYKTDTGTRHIGPMAQDFYAAFAVGPDDKHITTVDEGGVALAAIQGLNQKLEESTKAKDSEIAELQQSVTELKSLMQSITANK